MFEIEKLEWTRDRGYSDRATTAIKASIKSMWYRLSYACSPEDSSFKAEFSHMDVTECKWLAHDGQQPD